MLDDRFDIAGAVAGEALGALAQIVDGSQPALVRESARADNSLLLAGLPGDGVQIVLHAVLKSGPLTPQVPFEHAGATSLTCACSPMDLGQASRSTSISTTAFSTLG
jgi:hypothetical protein